MGLNFVCVSVEQPKEYPVSRGKTMHIVNKEVTFQLCLSREGRRASGQALSLRAVISKFCWLGVPGRCQRTIIRGCWEQVAKSLELCAEIRFGPRGFDCCTFFSGYNFSL